MDKHKKQSKISRLGLIKVSGNSNIVITCITIIYLLKKLELISYGIPIVIRTKTPRTINSTEKNERSTNK